MHALLCHCCEKKGLVKKETANGVRAPQSEQQSDKGKGNGRGETETNKAARTLWTPATARPHHTRGNKSPRLAAPIAVVPRSPAKETGATQQRKPDREEEKQQETSSECIDMAGRRLPQYEINAVDARLDQIIGAALAPAPLDPEDEAYFSERVNGLAADLQANETNFARRVERALGELRRTGGEAVSALDRVALMAQSGDSESILAQTINRGVLPTLSRATEARQRVQGLDREASRIYGSLCGEIDEIADEFGIADDGGTVPDPQEVVRQFLEGGRFQVNDPRLGVVEVDPKAFAAAYGPARLVEWASEKIGMRDIASSPPGSHAGAIADLRQRCTMHPAQAAKRVRDEAASATEAMRLQAEQIVPALIDALGQRGIRAAGAGGEALRALTQALNTAFGVQVAVEISEPQIDLDPYYAQLIDACNSPYGVDRARVAHLAEIVGVPPDVIAGLDAQSICQAALQSGF